MANVGYDSQSFTVDGRRIWLASGAIHYPRVPRALWRDRIRAARQSGLNCIETYVFWNWHETEPGTFDFEGDKDLRAFVELIAEAGMWCILRPGPYVCAEWDGGGLPAWLYSAPGVEMRVDNGPFKEACARYLGRVMQEVADLQVTQPAPGLPPSVKPGNASGAAAGGFTPGSAGGPIMLVQAENEWVCDNQQQHDGYLREIFRYLRENGCEVPINVCNQLYQRVDGTIDTWNASGRLASDLRQLRVVQDNAPRLVTEYWTGWFDQWDGPHADSVDAQKHLYRLGCMTGVGAQINQFMFHGGTNFGFTGGRTVNGDAAYMTTSYDYDAPLAEAGGRTAKYDAGKKLCMFTSQFAHVLANIESDYQPAALALDDGDHPVSVLHQRGGQGELVMILRSEKDRTKQTTVMLPNGLKLPVHLGKDRAAWLLLNARLPGSDSELTWTNLRPWAFVDRRMLVLFGPAGTEGLVAIDGAQVNVQIPKGKKPLVEKTDEITLVVLNEDQADAAYLDREGLLVGCQGLDADGRPIPRGGWSSATRVQASGAVSSHRVSSPDKPRAPRLGSWQYADQTALINGADEVYESIDGPAGLGELDTQWGYGWYRVKVRGSVKGNTLFPCAGDRIHHFRQGKLERLVGFAPGTEHPAPESMAMGGENVFLADNLGRFNYGHHIGRDPKGLPEHILHVKAIDMSKPEVVQERGPELLDARGYVTGHHRGDRRQATTLRWKFRSVKRKDAVLDLTGFKFAALIEVNEQPIDIYEPGCSAEVYQRVLRVGEEITGGNNELVLRLTRPCEAKARDLKPIKLYLGTKDLTTSADWAYCKWGVPADDDFRDAPKRTPMLPAWYRTTFSVSSADTPLWLEPNGMSKGQIFINGHNAGRYFMATHTGKAVGPQSRYYLPEPWLNTDGPNVLTLFDEHGKSPEQCKLVYDPYGPYGTASRT